MMIPATSRLLATILIACAASACTRDDAAPAPGSTAADSDAQLMQKGLEQLYQKADPVGAEQTFRSVLAHTPSHYGARYQLAMALDRGGRPADARAEWSEVQRQAEAIKDSATLRTARARLAAPDTANIAATMVLGLDLLYRQANPAAAVPVFRNVLRRNPTHYGATYQLAQALDKTGQTAEARALWVKVLGMATEYKDEKTAATARSRLQ